MRKKAWILSGSVFAAVIGSFYCAYLLSVQRTIDDFRFLGGRSPILRGVEIRYPTAEYRYYSWEGDFKQIKAAAARELAAAGFTASKSPPDGHFVQWKNSQGTIVEMYAGRTVTREDLRTSAVDPGWVTVGCDSPLPDNWVSHLRLALEPSH